MANTPVRPVPTQEDVDRLVAVLYEVVDKLEVALAGIVPQLLAAKDDDEGVGHA